MEKLTRLFGISMLVVVMALPEAAFGNGIFGGPIPVSNTRVQVQVRPATPITGWGVPGAYYGYPQGYYRRTYYNYSRVTVVGGAHAVPGFGYGGGYGYGGYGYGYGYGHRYIPSCQQRYYGGRRCYYRASHSCYCRRRKHRNFSLALGIGNFFRLGIRSVSF